MPPMRPLAGLLRPSSLGLAASPRAVMARVGAYLYAAGGTLTFVALALPHSPRADEPIFVAVGAISYVAALVLTLGGERLPGWAFHVALLWGTVLISSAIRFAGTDATDNEVLYLWTVLYAFYFFRPRAAIPHLGFAGLCYAALLASADSPEAPVTRWIVAVGSLAVAGLLVGALRERVERLIARLADAAQRDPLTDLLNRRGLEELVDLERERAVRSDRPLSVLVGDLDGFREVNDRFGHLAGDRVLQHVGALLETGKRRIDIAARPGGEEFALLMPDTDEHGAYIVAERLRAEVREAFASGEVPLTISFGIATFPVHGITMEAVLAAADEALYAAKQLGRDRSVIHSPEIAGLLNGPEGRSAGAEAHLATVLTLAEALDIRDTGTAQHSRRAGRFAEMMARELGFEPALVQRVRLAGLLHDVGKIGVPDSILGKRGPLTANEWLEMRKHPEIGARILASPHFDDLRIWVLAHHERPDGRGYPFGLAGDDIPVEARIVAVADAYEAMTADRVYRPSMGEAAAREELRRCAGTQFDEDVVEALLRALDREQALAT
jgi:diguanylate cyclase (GGDEF)-like protein/putative nucleotidyltransferase with HDIG domain